MCAAYSVLQKCLEMAVDVDRDSAIDIPQRPTWNYGLSKQQLDANEERYFKVQYHTSLPLNLSQSNLFCICYASSKIILDQKSELLLL